MKLTKEQALDLIKVLSHYQALDQRNVCAPTVHATLGSLERFVVGEEEEEDEDDLDSAEADDCCDHSHGDDDEEEQEDDEADEDPSEEEDDEESDEQEDDEGDEADDEGEEADGEGDDEDLDVDSYALGADLHDLKVAKAKIISSSLGDPDDEVTLEFENTEGDDADVCDLLVNGDPIGPITHVRRKGTELHVAEDNSGERSWHRFHISRFPKGWTDALPLDDLVEIE